MEVARYSNLAIILTMTTMVTVHVNFGHWQSTCLLINLYAVLFCKLRMSNGKCGRSITLSLQMWLHANLFNGIWPQKYVAAQCVILLKDYNGKYGSVPCSAPHKIIFYYTFVVSTRYYCRSQYKHDHLLPVPIIYVLVPCSVMGPGLQHNTRIIRDESLETDGIVAAMVTY